MVIWNNRPTLDFFGEVFLVISKGCLTVPFGVCLLDLYLIIKFILHHWLLKCSALLSSFVYHVNWTIMVTIAYPKLALSKVSYLILTCDGQSKFKGVLIYIYYR